MKSPKISFSGLNAKVNGAESALFNTPSSATQAGDPKPPDNRTAPTIQTVP